MSTSNVLVVDDEADIRALIQDILSDEGYGVTAAADADDFTAFNDLTQDIVETWLEASELDVDEIKAKLDARITEKITPTSVTKKTPW